MSAACDATCSELGRHVEEAPAVTYEEALTAPIG